MAKQNIGVSVGIIPWYYDEESNQTFFLMGHPSNKPKNYWLYMRGMVESWENLKETAIREFKEESDVDVSEVSDSLEYIGLIKQREGKSVAAFSLCVNDESTPLKVFNTDGMHSNMCCGGTVPEIDDYAWLSLEDVVRYTHETNIKFYTDIVRKHQTK